MNDVAAQTRKCYVAAQLKRYWRRGEEAVLRLGISRTSSQECETLPPRVRLVPLPAWASDLDGGSGLLVAERFVGQNKHEPWRDVDWWAAADWYLSGQAERTYERQHGPIHSYSLRLHGWDPRLWERAWVNRIALWLRRWTAHERGAAEEELFGPLPDAEIVLTHDVDAVSKTLAIRCKQSAFGAYGAARALAGGRVGRAGSRLGKAAKFFFG